MASWESGAISSTSRTEWKVTTMQPEADNSHHRPSSHEPETASLESEPCPERTTGPSAEQPQRPKVITGGYYWFPTPDAGRIIWSVVSCRDLRCGPDDGHDADLWPRLMVPLAKAWGKDAQILKRQLALSYTGLPRGRVTRPGKQFMILHGNDSPTPMWEPLVIESFRLSGRKVKFVYDEHETMIAGHPRAVEASLGLRFYEAKT